MVDTCIAFDIFLAEVDSLAKPGGADYRLLTFTRNAAEPYYSNTSADNWDLNDTIFDNFHNICSNASNKNSILGYIQGKMIERTDSSNKAKKCSYHCDANTNTIKFMFKW